MERIRVLIATREPSRLERMIPAIVATGRFTIVGLTGSAATAVDECKRLRPNVVLAGLDLKSPDAWQLAEEVRKMHDIAVVLFGPAPDPHTLKRAFQSGVRDVLFEPLTADDVISSLDRVLEDASTAPETGRSESPPQGKVITIFGTKGGVGKSFITANVALSAHIQSQKRCVLVDLDLEFGTLAALYGLRPQATIVDLCRTEGVIGPSIVEKVLIRAQNGTNLYLLAAPPTPDLAAEVEGEGRRVRGRSYVTDILTCLRSMFDFIFVDTASNFRETNLTALDLSDLIVVVTAPDIPTLQNTGKCLDILLEMLNYPQDKVSVALNRADGGAGLTVGDITKGLQYDVKYQLPSDGKNAVWCANCGRPVVSERPKTPLAESLNSMANSLIWQLTDDGTKERLQRSQRRKGVLGWITSMNQR